MWDLCGVCLLYDCWFPYIHVASFIDAIFCESRKLQLVDHVGSFLKYKNSKKMFLVTHFRASFIIHILIMILICVELIPSVFFFIFSDLFFLCMCLNVCLLIVYMRLCCLVYSRY